MTAPLSRRTFALSTLALVATTRAAGAQARTAIRCSSSPDDDPASVLYAIDTGMFKKVGLDVTIERGNSGAAISAAVAGGAIDIGKSSVVSLISAHQKGVPFVLVAGASVYDAVQKNVAMLVASDSAIMGPKDLPGKTVGVPALNDLYTIANNAFADRAGVAWRDIKTVEIPAASAPASVMAHRIDATTVTTPALSAAMETGKVRIIGYPFSSIAEHFVRAAWFTTKEYAEKNADAVARFRKVVTEAAAIVNAKPAQSIAVVAAFTNQSPALIARMPRAIEIGPVDPKLLQPAIDAAFKYGGMSATFDAHEMLAPGADRA
jgi:NitT/TauT family transport system substrate-binding protein